MSCGGDTQIFRLLDGYVGWDEADCEFLTGLAFNDANGIKLAQVSDITDCKKEDPFVSPGEILQYIPPAQLAHGCEHCDWFLVYKARLLHHDCCSQGWQSVWRDTCDQHTLKEGIAIAARGHRVAVADPGAKRIWILHCDGEQLIASVDAENLSGIAKCDSRYLDKIEELGPLAFTPWGELLVADTQNHSIWRFSTAGDLYGPLQIALPKQHGAGKINRLAVSNDCSIWLITGPDDYSNPQLWRASRSDEAFTKSSGAELKKSFERIGLTAANKDHGFCIEECGPEGRPVPICFKWNGEPSPDPIDSPPPPRRREQGQLLTGAIDSGIPRCRWHRLRLEAEVPSGATLEVSVATAEQGVDGKVSAKGDREQETGWESFSAGFPHHLDWQVAPTGALDFLINQPPGRFLYL